MMEAIVKSLRPGGRVVLVEYRGEDPKVPIKPHHKMTEAQAKKEKAAVGLTHAVTKEVLPWQHIMIFQKRKGVMEADEKNTGASAAFTSSDPVVKQALALVGDGKFKEAQSLLASDDGHADPAVQK